MDHQKNIDTVLYDGSYVQSKDGTPVISTIAPPIEIFCPVFSEFTRKISDPSFQPTAKALKAVSEFMSIAAAIHSTEKSYTLQARPHLSAILGSFFGNTAATDLNRSADGRVSKQFGSFDIPLIMGELKRALGEGGCDAMRQAAYSTLDHWYDPSVC